MNEETQTQTGDQAQGASNDVLANQPELQEAIRSLYKECCKDDRTPRLVEVIDVRQAENYWQGRHYDYWSDTDQCYKSSASAGIGLASNPSTDDVPKYEFVTNFYQARGLMVIAAIAGAPPRIRFFPANADQEPDTRTAEGRTKLSRLIQRWNPAQKMLQQEAYHAWTGGFIVWWSRYVPDGEKYGYDSTPKLTMGSQDVDDVISCPNCGWSAPAATAVPPIPCPQCGSPLTAENISQEEPISIPQDDGDEQVPKGRQVISVYGALNCKRPQHTNEQSQWHYFGLEEETHYSILRAAHPDPSKAKLIKAGSTLESEDLYERNARLGVAENTRSKTGTTQAALVTHCRIWFRPSAFWMIDDETKRDQLLELFPSGGRFEFAGDVFRMSEAESMDDAIVSTHALPGRGQHRPAIGSSTISLQDRFNSFTNIATETYEFGIPITYRDQALFNPDADEDIEARPGMNVNVALPTGDNITNHITQVRADSASSDMLEQMQEIFGPQSDQISGAYPALSGAGEDQPNTLGQQSMQRDQAMGRMGIFYVNLKQARADLMTISCKCFEKHAEGEVKIPVFGQSGDFESETVDVTALEGDAEAFPEGDENFPELWNQQRATMMQIMDTPYGQKLSQDMGNAELFGRMTGIPDLKIPGLDSWRKQLKEIGELTKMPDGQDDNPLGPVAPFVEVDPANDDHVVEEACCGWWLNNEVGQKLKLTNPPGWQAVSEHRAKHKAAIPKEPPPQKPLSETFTAAYKDLPPEAQAQVLEQMGVHVDPKDFLVKAALDKAAKTPPHNPHQPNQFPDPPATGMPPPAGASEPPVNAVGG